MQRRVHPPPPPQPPYGYVYYVPVQQKRRLRCLPMIAISLFVVIVVGLAIFILANMNLSDTAESEDHDSPVRYESGYPDDNGYSGSTGQSSGSSSQSSGFNTDSGSSSNSGSRSSGSSNHSDSGSSSGNAPQNLRLDETVRGDGLTYRLPSGWYHENDYGIQIRIANNRSALQKIQGQSSARLQSGEFAMVIARTPDETGGDAYSDAQGYTQASLEGFTTTIMRTISINGQTAYSIPWTSPDGPYEGEFVFMDTPGGGMLSVITYAYEGEYSHYQSIARAIVGSVE